MDGWVQRGSDGWTEGRKRGIGIWGRLSVLGLILAMQWMDGWIDGWMNGLTRAGMWRPNCLWPGCKHGTTKLAAENEGGISGKELRVREQWYLTPRLCPCVKHTLALWIGADKWPAESRGKRTSSETLRQERNISGAERLVKDYRTRKRLSEVNDKIGIGHNGERPQRQKCHCGRPQHHVLILLL